MAQLGKAYFEISRGYIQRSKVYKCPYVTGVNIHDKEKPFVVVMGDSPYDTAASVISARELISGKWDDHIIKSNCQEFVAQLKKAMDNQEEFPQKFILDLVNK